MNLSLRISDFVANLEDFGFTNINVSEPADATKSITFINTNETEFTMSIGSELSVFTCKFRPLGKRARTFGTGTLSKFDYKEALTL